MTVYTPNAKGDLSRLKFRHENWDPAFLAYLKSLNKRKPVAGCAATSTSPTRPTTWPIRNPTLAKPALPTRSEDGIQKILDAGFVDTFRMFTQGNGHYTWWSNFSQARDRNVGWRIDYFLVSADLAPRIAKAEIHADIMGSDHCPVSITLKG